MLGGPVTLRVVRVRYVIRRGKPPGTVLGQQEGEILGVIVTICCGHVEDHPTEHLSGCFPSKAEAFDDLKELGIVVGPNESKVKMTGCAEALNMNFAAIFKAVETPSHEVRPTAFVQ